MDNVIKFPVKEPEPTIIDQSGRAEPGKYGINVGMGNRIEMWSPPFFRHRVSDLGLR